MDESKMQMANRLDYFQTIKEACENGLIKN